MAKVGIVFGSNKGDAKKVAEYVGKNFDSEIVDAKELTADFIASHDKLIFVASTHKVGELQNDFKEKIPVLAESKFEGKTLALVGVGSVSHHADTFNDGLVEFLPVIRGAKLVGAWEDDKVYAYKNSLAFINGKFVGLVLDVNENANWESQADKWISSIKADF